MVGRAGILTRRAKLPRAPDRCSRSAVPTGPTVGPRSGARRGANDIITWRIRRPPAALGLPESALRRPRPHARRKQLSSALMRACQVGRRILRRADTHSVSQQGCGLGDVGVMTADKPGGGPADERSDRVRVRSRAFRRSSISLRRIDRNDLTENSNHVGPTSRTRTQSALAAPTP